MAEVLIVDDEQEIVELLTIYLKNSGFQSYGVYDGLSALKILKERKIDVILLDVMLPDTDGFSLIREIQKTYDVPIMFLSAKGEDADKILGLGLGADDYVVKPFNPLEVVARIQVLLRRYRKIKQGEENLIHEETNLKVDELCINRARCEVFKGAKRLVLTSMEYKLLLFLALNPNRVFTKRQLYENVWEEEYEGDENIIMVYICKLRDKIEEDSQKPKYIKTIRGLGYRFEGKLL
ncbi:DNA-binding response OmpR family regulator [Lachnotalea glycerini]|uniref:Stage 0 sporulation protein A homolog n=1 Tax=Lachnotalea glycerini TaxID=1763509 RepID=A0A255JLD9_9FIRM|nr:response regulator transcription factor [Lachnotalea glycerini]OYO51454.1 DNA-binding response regulator [Lachnotalea glycerini]PXV84886.1 DNA-binding response OmpR family regulator [Lachnotalea glycerini]RDY29091.1 DNA-binding response regulator [Lachnotalea glycerini]